MLYSALKAIHVLSIIVWVGGMVFVAFFLRPAIAVLEPSARVKLMHDVLGRFFKAVSIAALAILGSGLWMMGRVAKQTVQSGGQWTMPVEWIVMAALGIVMMLIFGHIRFALYKRLTRAVAANDWAAGGAALASIRQSVLINLAIGAAIVVIVFVGAPK
jgi:uncharacterized membrane protein